MKAVGLDLAGKQENDTGFCLIDNSNVKTLTLGSDIEILELIKGADPDVIAVDAPLSFPKEGMYRECDDKLRKRGYDILSPNYPGMRVLVNRARSLVSKLERTDGFEIIETSSDVSEDILPVKRTGDMTDDEFEAFVCALTAVKYLQDDYENLGGMIVPVDSP